MSTAAIHSGSLRESKPPCFQDALQFRDARDPPGDHNFAIQHYRWSAHDAEFQNLGNVRDMGNVGREIEFRTSVDDVSFGRLAAGATWPRDLDLQSCTSKM